MPASPRRPVPPDTGRWQVERRPGLAPGAEPQRAPGQRRGDAVGVKQEAAPGATASTAATKRRCCSMGSSTSGMPQIAVPIRPCSAAGSASGRAKASPWTTVTPGRPAPGGPPCRARSRPPRAARRARRRQQGAGDGPRAGAEFDHHLLAAAFDQGRDAPPQRRRGRHDRAHLQRVGRPAAQEQAEAAGSGAAGRAVAEGQSGHRVLHDGIVSNQGLVRGAADRAHPAGRPVTVPWRRVRA